jgi:hypothetical protein
VGIGGERAEIREGKVGVAEALIGAPLGSVSYLRTRLTSQLELPNQVALEGRDGLLVFRACMRWALMM